MSAFPKLLIGLIALFVLGFLGIHTNIFPHHFGEAKLAQSELQAQAETSLKDFTWANVQLDGQKAVITGSAPTKDAAEAARRAVLKSSGSGGVMGGGITVVDTDATRIADSKVPPVAAPFTWEATYEKGGPVTLAGFVPSEEARATIIAEAQKRYPGGVIDEMQIARGVPRGALEPEWTTAVVQNLAALRRLNSGGIRASNTRFELYGDAPSLTAKEKAEKSASKMAAGYESVSLLTAPDPVPDPIPDPASPPAPEPEKIPPAQIAAEIDRCQDRFNEALDGNTINFQSGQATIKNDSRPLLDQLAGVARSCAEYNIAIAGHTDSTGGATMNQRLSEARAVAIARYLTKNGVSADHINARGYGEAKPIAPNTTPAGRAINRRITFTVSAR